MGVCGAFTAATTTIRPATSNSKVDMAALRTVVTAAVSDDEALLAAKSILIYFLHRRPRSKKPQQ